MHLCARPYQQDLHPMRALLSLRDGSDTYRIVAARYSEPLQVLRTNADGIKTP